MDNVPISFDLDLSSAPALKCPLCGDVHVHIDDVYVLGRPREDGPTVPVHVNSHGNVDETSMVPLGPDGAGRRHTVSLGGWCESCRQHFALAFQQHKGSTFVSVVKKAWVPAG